MIIYQIWVDDRLESTRKNISLENVQFLCQETWQQYCKEPYPAKVPEVWWCPADEEGFVTGFFYWWPHKAFVNDLARERFLMEEHSKGHYIKFDILPLDLG